MIVLHDHNVGGQGGGGIPSSQRPCISRTFPFLPSQAVFVKCTRPMMNMLKCIMPYIVCGYPNLKTVKQLVLKKGFGRVNKQRIPITNNEMISASLGRIVGLGIERCAYVIQDQGRFHQSERPGERIVCLVSSYRNSTSESQCFWRPLESSLPVPNSGWNVLPAQDGFL